MCTSVSQIQGSGEEQGCDPATVWRQAQRYSQREGNVLTLGHCAVQRDLKGLVVLLVILSPREVNLDLVMEYCREGHWHKACQSVFMETLQFPNDQAIQTHRACLLRTQATSAPSEAAWKVVSVESSAGLMCFSVWLSCTGETQLVSELPTWKGLPNTPRKLSVAST